MRHFSLLKLLTFSSFTSSDGLQNVGPNVGATTGFGRSHRLHKSIQATSTAISSTSSSETNGSKSSLTAAKSRRKVLKSAVAAFLAATPSAKALDMDAFVNAQLDMDTKNCDPKRDPKCIPKLSQDEALCKYGQSGNARGEACKRVKEAGGALPSSSGAVKSLGGAYAM